MLTVRDEALIQLIVARLGADFRTGGQTIEVQVSDGEIVLVGMCDTEEQRAVAEIIARGVCGVHRVIDKITIRHLVHAI